MARWCAALAGTLVLVGPTAPALAQTGGGSASAGGSPSAGVLLLFDSSKSMGKDAGDGQTRIEAAKGATRSLVEGLPPNAQVGVRAYGSRVAETSRTEACRDTRSLVDVGPLDRDGIIGAVDGLEPTGRTPVGRSLREAPGDFPEGLDRRSIVLVSDGGDNCAPPDPCRVAREVAREGIELSIQVIGLRVDASARRQLRCIARAGGGTYVDAGDPDELLRELRAALARATRTYKPSGQPIQGSPDPARAAPARSGDFLDAIRPGEQLHYAVAVPRNHRLWFAATAIAPRTASTDGIPLTRLRLEMLDTTGRPQRESFTTFKAKDLPVATAAVWGAPVGQEPGYWARPGRYVARVELGSEDIVAGEYPLELAVRVLPDGLAPGDRGDPVGRRAPTPADPVGEDPGETGAGAEDDGGSDAPVLSGAAGGGVALGAAGGVALLRRRRP